MGIYLSPPSLHRSHTKSWNINHVSITSGLSPFAKGRLTPRRLTLRGKPWFFGGHGFHVSCGYLCQHSYFATLHHGSRLWLLRRCEYSPTAGIIRYQPSVSVLHLSPDYLRREFSRWVSCYAIFKGWLLLSQPPHCLRNLTSLSALSVDLGTLTWDQGCFPFDVWSFAPIV